MRRLALALLLGIATAGAALAQGPAAEARWPDKPIRMIVPLPAGAAVDIVARLICARLSERLGQTIIVENRAGASGALASEAVAKAAPDGYTLGMATSTTHVTTAILNAKLPYDPVKDFVPVALIGIVPYVLTVSPNLPARNLSELIALAKTKPRTLSYSSVGQASLAHLATELMSTMAGVELTTFLTAPPVRPFSTSPKAASTSPSGFSAPAWRSFATARSGRSRSRPNSARNRSPTCRPCRKRDCLGSKHRYGLRSSPRPPCRLGSSRGSIARSTRSSAKRT
jgi:hypothetical protein